MNLEKGNGESVSARWVIAVILIHVALLFVLFSRAAAQTPQPVAPADEVYRIVIAKDVGDKEGRDNRLMLETLGYIPVHMRGDFTESKGAVLLGNYPTQKEAQRIKEQLVRDGFAPLEIVKEARSRTGTYTVLAGSFRDEPVAKEQKLKLEAGGLLNVRIQHDKVASLFHVTVGNFTSPDQAHSVVANLKEMIGFREAKIVIAETLADAGIVAFASDAPARVTASDIKKAMGKDLSDADLNEITMLIEKKLALEAARKGSTAQGGVSEEIVKLNKRLEEMDEMLGGVVKDVAPMHHERLTDANKRREISELFRDSNNLAKGGRNEEALIKVREILATDPENQIAQQRQSVLQRMLDGYEVDSSSAKKTEGRKMQLSNAYKNEISQSSTAISPYSSAPPTPVPSIQPPLPPLPPPGDMYFKHPGFNNFVLTAEDSESTFAADVDTGSYTVARNYLERQMLPPASAIRIEEIINYMPDRYAPPENSTFAVYSEAAPSPFGKGLHIMKVGIKGRETPRSERKPLVLTFVVDCSGSMRSENRLELVKRMLVRLTSRLEPADKVGIAIYSHNGQELLAHTSVTNRQTILDAIQSLRTSGSTNAAEGLTIGYGMARRAFDGNATNRVILCSDGVANVGATGPEAILAQIAQTANDRIYLSAIGVGMGNYNDTLMETLANKGNGTYAYLDDDMEAAKYVDGELLEAMEVIAQDVKIQVKFNADAVRAYRLLGFENRDVPDHEFRNDKRDAGELGSGHSVTALYEVELTSAARGTNLADVFIRFKQPGKNMEVKEVKGTLRAREVVRERFDQTDEHLKLAVIAAEYAEILRESPWARDGSMSEVARMYDAAFEGGDPCSEASDLRQQIGMAVRLLASRPEIPPLSSAVPPPAPRDGAAAIPLTE